MTATTLENAVSLACATKQLAPQLQLIKPPEPLQLTRFQRGRYAFWDFVLSPLSRLGKSSPEDEKTTARLIEAVIEDEAQFYRSYGAETDQEKTACLILYNTANALSGNLLRPNVYYCDIETVKASPRGGIEEAKIPYASLGRHLSVALKEGLTLTKNRDYSMAHPFFQEIAFHFLQRELVQKLAYGSVDFLDTIKFRRQGDEIFVRYSFELTAEPFCIEER